MKAERGTNLTTYLFEHDKDFGLRFSDHARLMAGASHEGDPTIFEGETDDDIAYMEVQRLRSEGLRWQNTAYTGYLADKVRHIWNVLHDGFNRGYWDFLRLLEYAAETGLTFRADYVAVDEINDNTPLMCRIVGRSQGRKVVFCGDLNQSIHGWLGVRTEAILGLPHDTVERQNESYRLGSAVAGYADGVISHLTGVQQRIKALNGVGEVIRDPNFRSVLSRLEGLGNTFILGRTNWIVTCARREAISMGLNVVMTDEEMMIRELYSLITDRPLTFPMNKLPCLTGAWVPSKRFWKHGAKTALGEVNQRFLGWEALYEYGTPDLRRLLNGDIFLEVRDGFDPLKPIIRCMTFHASKGLQEQNVVVLRDLDTKVENALWRSAESEIKCSYVAVTRAAKRLIITSLDGGKMNNYLC